MMILYCHVIFGFFFCLLLLAFFVCVCGDNEAFAITTSDIKRWPVIFFAKLDDDSSTLLHHSFTFLEVKFWHWTQLAQRMSCVTGVLWAVWDVCPFCLKCLSCQYGWSDLKTQVHLKGSASLIWNSDLMTQYHGCTMFLSFWNKFLLLGVSSDKKLCFLLKTVTKKKKK